MSSLAMPSLNTGAITPAAPTKSDDPAKVRDAGQQFEALLIGQILHSAHEDGTGWLGTPEDSSSDCASDYAEQQFAAVMAKSGGIGIAHMIARNLKEPASPQANSPQAAGLPHLDKSPGNTSLARKLRGQ